MNPQEDMVAGKTGVFDDSIMIDSDEWIHPFLAVLVQGRRPEQALWKSDGNRIVSLFMAACQHLGLMGLSPCRYALRHGGASDDLASHRRDLAGIKKRGGWRTDASLRRYAKETRLQAEVMKIPASTRAFGIYVRDHLPAAFARTLPYQLPPCQPLVAPAVAERATTAGRHRRQRVA